MKRAEMVVELRELRHRLLRIETALCEEERRADETFQKIMDAIRDNDEAVTSMGGALCFDHHGEDAPIDGGCMGDPDAPALTHDCALPEEVADLRDEPPSVPA